MHSEPAGESIGLAMSTSVDVAGPARTFIQYTLTIGAALVFALLVLKVGLDIWVGSDPVVVDKVRGAVMNSIAITFGSAFVGWFGVSARHATITVDQEASRLAKFGHLFFELAGAAVFAMLVYLAAGAFAALTYLFNQGDTPTVLITVATAWAAQASAVVAATLSAVLRPPGGGSAIAGAARSLRADAGD